MHKFIFGVFSKEEKLIIPLGKPISCTFEQAELIATIFSKASYVLNPDDYFAYDFAEKHKVD